LFKRKDEDSAVPTAKNDPGLTDINLSAFEANEVPTDNFYWRVKAELNSVGGRFAHSRAVIGCGILLRLDCMLETSFYL